MKESGKLGGKVGDGSDCVVYSPVGDKYSVLSHDIDAWGHDGRRCCFPFWG